MATTTMQVSQVAGKVGSQVGRSLPRLEAREKVTGRAEYTHTMRLPGMLSREYRLEHDRFPRVPSQNFIHWRNFGDFRPKGAGNQ
jgi:hypothetical protein